MPQKVWRRLNRTAIMAGLALADIAACGAAGDGRYVGVASTEQGSCGLGFDEAGKAASTLLIRGNEVKFAPSDGVVVLEKGEWTMAAMCLHKAPQWAPIINRSCKSSRVTNMARKSRASSRRRGAGCRSS